ncbi:MAG: hypothetical protein Q8R32_03755 [bacterium]|nr:hypothetical protein [bacterium]
MQLTVEPTKEVAMPFSNLNPYPDHQPSWKHIAILFAVIATLIAFGVTVGVMQAEAQEQYWSLVPVNPGQAAETGQHHYRFTLRTARPTKDDWKFVIGQLGDYLERGGMLQAFQVLPCPEGLCGMVMVRFDGQLN